MAIRINGTTVIDNSRNFTNIQDISANSLTYNSVNITSTASEINRLDGVTNNVQTQINSAPKDRATLEKTFTVDEEETITLSPSLSSGVIPVVGVTKDDNGAIVDTDYEIYFTATDTAVFKALSAGNFKIRVVA